MPDQDITTGSPRTNDASQELARRTSATSIAHLILLTVLMYVAPSAQHHSRILLAIGIAGLLAGGARLALSWRIVAQTNHKQDSSWAGLVASTHACAVAWSVFCCMAAATSSHGPIFLLVLTVTLVMASAEAVALSPDAIVARSYLTILLAPVLLWELSQGPGTAYYAAAAVALCLVYSLLRVQQQSSVYSKEAAARATLSADVEALHRSISELEAVKTQADQASRAKAELLATMSHTIRTPLNDVILVSELLLGTDLTPEQRDFVHTIHTSGDALLSGINDILDFTSIEAGRLTLQVAEFELRSLVEKATNIVADQARRKGSALTYRIEPEVALSFTGDPGRVHQILLHFLNSAVDGIPQGQQLRLQVDASKAYGACVTLRFSGIYTRDELPHDEETLEPVNESAPPAARRPEGATLGRTICSRILDLMGGHMVAESALDNGAIFCFTVPLRISEPASKDQAPDLRQARILVVDDNATNRKLLLSQLARLGAGAVAVDSGLAALNALASAADEHQPYHAVLVNEVMPQMSGARFAGAVREKPALDEAVLILLHAQSVPAAIEELRAAGFADRLQKPVSLEDLRHCLLKNLQHVQNLRPVTEPALCQVRGRLLLADDNPMNQKVAVRVLEKLGYYVDTVSNGSDAVEKLQNGLYDAVLMDCQMPVMDGYAATQEIRRREGNGRHTVIIAITASAMSGDRKRCLEAGMDDYVTKPVRSSELQQMLERHLTRATPQQPKVVTQTGVRAATGVLGDRLWELEHDVGSAAMEDLIGELISETSRYVDRLQNAMARADGQAAIQVIEALHDCCANVGATRMTELCSELANQRNPVKDYGPALDALVEAHQSLVHELEDLYPACRMRAL